MFRVRVSLSSLSSYFRKVSQYQKNEALKQAAKIVVSDVKQNMSEGRDSHGVPFKPYTPRYAKRRRKLGLQTERVDLEVTHGLKDSIAYYEGEHTVTVDSGHQVIAEGLNNKRQFLGDPDDPNSKTAARIADAIGKGLERITG